MNTDTFKLLVVLVFLLSIITSLASCKNPDNTISEEASALTNDFSYSAESKSEDLTSSENHQLVSLYSTSKITESKVMSSSNATQKTQSSQTQAPAQTTQTPPQTQTQTFNKSSLANSCNVGMIYEFDKKLFYKNKSGYICTRNSDGTNETVIVPKYVSEFKVSDGYGYYVINIGELYRFSLSNTVDVQKYTIQSTDFAVSGNYLFYTDMNKCLYRINLDGNGDPLVILKNCVWEIHIINNFIYYVFDDLVHNKYQLYRIALDGSNVTMITNGPIGYFCNYNNQLYYSKGSCIYRSNLDGSGEANTGAIGYNINACDEKIYYIKDDPEKDGKLYSMNPDGSNQLKIG